LIYRSEIDGLRPLAVISVVIFHFFPSIMPFGYLGVDIFFVISGYLITSHLLSMRGNSISFILNNFYTRRIKRLFPALFVFFFVTTIFVVSIFIRNDIKNFLNSLIASS